MKKAYALFLILFFTSILHAQDTISKPVAPAKTPTIGSDRYISAYYIVPGAVGNNVLAKANEGIFGLGMSFSMYVFRGFYFSTGFESSRYNVTDPSLAGNIDHTNVTNFYADVLYKLPVTDKFSVFPKISLGYVSIHQKTDSKGYGTQWGMGYTAGLNADYKLTRVIKVFAGTNFTLLRPETDTKPEYQSFYGHLTQVNVVLGLKIKM